MLRVVLQRFALQRNVAEQLEAVPLDEVLRRMQSSSLTNPARSLESHFVLAQPATAAPPSPSLSSSSTDSPPGRLLRQALSERLLAEVRRDITMPHLTLDVGSLMLANCLRHELSPLATQQILALWLRFMRRGAGSRPSTSFPSSSIGSLSMLGLGRRERGGGGGSGAQSHQLLQFQSLVRVLEACLDAPEQQRPPSGSEETSTYTLDTTATVSAHPACLTLDDWAELVDTVEQYWPLFADHGASTAGLLVQFTALALELTGSASSTPASAEPESRFTNSLRRLSHLQTDRALLQMRVLGLCAEAVKALCAVESTKGGESGETLMYSRGGPWWHRPQELVRLSQARRRIEAFEAGEPRKGDRSNKATLDSAVREPAGADAGSPSSPSASSGAARRKTDTIREASGASLRGTRVGTHARPASSSPLHPSTASTTAAASVAGSRWVPLLSHSWWPSAASLGGTAATAGGGPSARVAKELGGYVTYHALQQTSTAQTPSRSGAGASGRDTPRYGTSSSTSLSPTLLTVSLKDVLEIFSTVCATASSGDSLRHVTTFSWWVRDVVHHQHGRRSLHDEHELTSLLGIAELCLAYPDGTQTALAEIMKALQHSTLFLWNVGDVVAASHFRAATLPTRETLRLWPRACAIVADALPLTTVGAEADRTLRALVSTAQQALSSSESDGCVDGSRAVAAAQQLLVRYRRYGVLILACLLLQRPNGYVTPTFAGHIRRLVQTVPFSGPSAGPNDLAAAVRALFLFTHLEKSTAPSARRSNTRQTEVIVSYLLDQVTGLLTASTSVEEGDGERGAAESLSRSLSSLSTTERQLLRSAMRVVREQAAKGETESSFLSESSALRVRERALADVAAAGSDFPSPAPVASLNEARSSASPPSGVYASPPLPQTRFSEAGPDHDGSHPRCEQRVLQRELEAVSRHFGARHSTL